MLNSASGYPVKAELDVMGIKANTEVLLYDVLGNIRFEGTANAKGFMGKNSGFGESADIAFKGDLKKVDATIKSFKIAGNNITGTVKANLTNKIPVVRLFYLHRRLILPLLMWKQNRLINFR